MEEQKNTSSNSENSTNEETQQDKGKRTFSEMREAWMGFYTKHRNAVIYTAIGFLIAASFLIVGFWGTLLLAIFIAIGMIIGSFKDGDKRAARIVKGLADRLD